MPEPGLWIYQQKQEIKMTVFDWITPLLAAAQDIAEGSSCVMEIVDGGRTGNQAKRILKRNGVKSWGWFISPGGKGICFTVRADQASEARDILAGHGIILG